MYIAAQENPDSYECEDVPMRDSYGGLVLNRDGEEIYKCTYVGGESEDNTLAVALAVIIPCLALIALCVACYCGTKHDKCCVTAESRRIKKEKQIEK